MKYNLSSVTKFGDMIKNALTQKSYTMIDKYKDYSRSSVFKQKVNNDVSNQETNHSSD